MTRTPRGGRPSRASLFAAVDQGVEELARIGGLPHPAEAEAIWDGIWHEEAHHSTAIEGNTLVMRQVRLLLDEGLAVGDKELREYLEVQGYAEAAKWVYEQARSSASWSADERLTLTELRHIHRLVVEQVWNVAPPEQLLPGEGAGAFRLHDILPFDGGMNPAPFTDIAPRIDDWLRFANAEPGAGAHLMQHLAAVHAEFEKIHPFRDGNGRTGRLALNLLLVRRGYPPVIVYKRDRPAYIRALQRTDRRDYGALAELFARAVRSSLDRFILPGLAGPHRLLPLSALATRSVTPVALRHAAERGRLRAIRQSDRWYSTKDWVSAYARTRRSRPKPKSGS